MTKLKFGAGHQDYNDANYIAGRLVNWLEKHCRDHDIPRYLFMGTVSDRYILDVDHEQIIRSTERLEC